MKRSYSTSPIYLIDKDNNIIKKFKSQTNAANELKTSPSYVNKIIKGKIRSSQYNLISAEKYKLLYEKRQDNVETTEIKEEKPTKIIKRKDKIYYVNMLVGLANGDLIDGASYTINGSVATYNKEKQALMIGEVPFMTRDKCFLEVEVELPLLTDKERSFLSNLLKAFTSVKGIRKCSDSTSGFCFIRIETNVGEDIVLPSFVETKYYGSLEKDRLYTLEELQLQD